MTTWNLIQEFAFSLWARATSGPAALNNIIKVATVSVAHSLAKLYNLGIAEDLAALKGTLWQRVQADTDARVGKARKVLAEATEAEQKANLVKRNDRISKADEQVKLAEAARTNAEAKARLIEAESHRVQQIADAQSKLLVAITAYKNAGGKIGVDLEGLEKVLGVEDLALIGAEPPTVRLSPPHMNLNDSPDEAQLAALLRACEGDHDDYILWVDIKGEVRVTPLPRDMTPIGFERSQSGMKMRYETLGPTYVGRDAAEEPSSGSNG